MLLRATVMMQRRSFLALDAVVVVVAVVLGNLLSCGVGGFGTTTTTTTAARRHNNQNEALSLTRTSRTQTKQSRLYYWSKQAIMDVATKKPILSATEYIENGRVLDVSSPRAWLMTKQKQGNAVYTVLRADLCVTNSSASAAIRDVPPWRLWGVDFHLDRLQKSYTTLHHHHHHPTSSSTIIDPSRGLQAAVQDSIGVSGALLAETFGNLVMMTQQQQQQQESECTSVVVMLTLLWYPRDSNNIIDNVQVEGHVYTSQDVVNPRHLPAPIHVALALDDDDDDKDEFVSLPNRKDDHPECKQASWCANRQPLERVFQTKGIGEVLLMESHLILEGLTSNVFFLYPGNLLKTPKDKVLKGYARHRVLQAAEALGYRVQQGPVSLDEADSWQEVFVTSAIRLVRPVESIVAHQQLDDDAIEHRGVLWKSNSSNYSIAKIILQQILLEESL